MPVTRRHASLSGSLTPLPPLLSSPLQLPIARSIDRSIDREMGTLANAALYSSSSPPLLRSRSLRSSVPERRRTTRIGTPNLVFCSAMTPTGSGTTSHSKAVEDYNTAMKRMMRNPYEYHHDLSMNYTIVRDSLIVGSQPQKPEDIDHLKEEQNVAYILCLQQDSDIEYWGIDFQQIVKRCKQLGIRHMRRPAIDFDPDSLRGQLPKAVSSLEWAISEGKGSVYVHCTAGLGRAPAVAIAYMFWFCDMDLNTAYETLTSKRPCGPNKRAIQGATYDLAKNDPWKEPFENLPEHAFTGIAHWEKELIGDRVRGLRGT